MTTTTTNTPNIDPKLAMRAKAAADGIDMELVDRFLDKTEHDPETGCLNWTAGGGHNGYGAFSLNGKTRSPHR
jgi:hypothetical protein